MTLVNNSSGQKSQAFANESKMTQIFSKYFENISDWYKQSVKEKEFKNFVLNTY